MNEKIPNNPEAVARTEASPDAAFTRMLDDAFDEALKAEQSILKAGASASRESVGRIRRLARKLKQAVVIGLIGVAVSQGADTYRNSESVSAHASSDTAESAPVPEMPLMGIQVAPEWIARIPSGDKEYSVVSMDGKWTFRRIPGRSSDALDAYDAMRREVAAAFVQALEGTPPDFRVSLGDMRGPKLVQDLQQLALSGDERADRFMATMDRMVEQMNDIEERYGERIEPLFGVTQPVGELTVVLTFSTIGTPEGQKAVDDVIQAFDNVGVQVTFTPHRSATARR